MLHNGKYLMVGGLVGLGFDTSSRFLLTVSHAGRGVFEVGTWNRVARDESVCYPLEGRIAGIGPLAGSIIEVSERNDIIEVAHAQSPDGRFEAIGESDAITIREIGT